MDRNLGQGLTLLVTLALLVSSDSFANPYRGYGVSAADDPYRLEASPDFPDWPLVRRDWSLGPILAYSDRKEGSGAYRRHLTIAEGGFQFALRDFFILEDNDPGFSIQPFVGMSWGAVTEKTTLAANSERQSSKFTRLFYGVRAVYYYNYFKYEMQLATGSIAYENNDFTKVREASLANDLGLRVTPRLSAHLSLTSSRLLQDGRDSLTSHDLWLYGLYRVAGLDMSVALGPGIKSTEGLVLVEEQGPRQTHLSSQYLASQVDWNILWKFGIDFEARYVFHSEAEAGAVTLDARQRALANLAAYRSDAAAAADSLHLYSFFGLRRLIGLFGAGYQVVRDYDNLSKPAARSSNSSSGFALVYQSVL